MKTSMAPQDLSSKRQHFHWSNKVSNEDEEAPPTLKPCPDTDQEEGETTMADYRTKEEDGTDKAEPPTPPVILRKKLQSIAVSRFRSVLTFAKGGKNRANSLPSLGPRVVGTLFGYRRGHVHFALQKNPASQPAFLIELSTPISGLVREMASGLVRIALECDKEEERRSSRRLLEEPVWRTYCNGKKCGFATKRECGEREWRVLKAVEPISMGAGVLPAEIKVAGEGPAEAVSGEIMYMRAKFERVVGSRDSEAFYMMNPDSNGAPELSVYLLRI